MATRGTIAVEHADGTVSGIYSHWDNHVDHNGKILVESYANRDMAEMLINHGDVSSLGNTIDECIFYHRDRGEELFISYKYGSVADYLNNHVGEDYDYLWTANDGWVVVDSGVMTKIVEEIG